MTGFSRRRFLRGAAGLAGAWLAAACRPEEGPGARTPAPEGAAPAGVSSPAQRPTVAVTPAQNAPGDQPGPGTAVPAAQLAYP